MCVESFFDYSSLGSFAVCDMRWKIVEIIHTHARTHAYIEIICKFVWNAIMS